MNQTEDDTTMKSEYYPDIEKKDLFKQGYIGDRFHHRFFKFTGLRGYPVPNVRSSGNITAEKL